eukprot:1318941-Amphidinium_carterae.1
MHHGDDFVAVGPRRATPKLGDALSTVFIVKGRGVLGPRPGDWIEADQGAEPHFDLEGVPDGDRAHGRQATHDSTTDTTRDQPTIGRRLADDFQVSSDA